MAKQLEQIRPILIRGDEGQCDPLCFLSFDSKKQLSSFLQYKDTLVKPEQELSSHDLAALNLEAYRDMNRNLTRSR